VRAYGVAAHRRGHGWDAQAESAAPAGWCLQSPRAARAFRRSEARASRHRQAGSTQSPAPLLVELNASGCANRTNLPTARRVGRVVGLEFDNRETQHLEIGVTGIPGVIGACGSTESWPIDLQGPASPSKIR